MKNPVQNRLITMPISHYCEKARWALEWSGIPYVEDRHLQGFHLFHTHRAGKKDSVPVLITENRVLTDSTDILHWCNDKAPLARKLYPSDPVLRKKIEEFEDKLDEGFGNFGRTWMYTYMLNRLPLILKYSKIHEVPKFELKLMPYIYPLIKGFIVKELSINPDSKEKCKVAIDQVFAEVEGLLSDGRSFLYGPEFSSADLTFAALSAAVLIPEAYGVTLPGLDELPEEMAAQVSKWRASVAGKYALKLFATYRRVGHPL